LAPSDPISGLSHLLLTTKLSCAQERTNGWLLGLATLGYDDSLPAPSLAIQAALATISDREIHEYIQTTDKTTLYDCDDDGEHVPLLLTTLDLSHWTSIMVVATIDKEHGV
jgi:hypothetical protein